MTRVSKVCPHCEQIQPCSTHSRKPWAGSTRREHSTLSGSAQQKRARYVLNRDDTICHVCGYPGSNEADHVQALALGGQDTVENMAAIHGPASDPTTCHGQKSQREAQAGVAKSLP